MSETFTSTDLPFIAIALRLALAAGLTALVGLERELDNQPAGLRTHMLVGLASALYVLLGLEIVARSTGMPEAVRVDPLRLIEAVTSGVAFLAAGLVVFSRGRVKGLTTGASLWLAAGVGVCCGMGLVSVAVLTAGLVVGITRVMKWVEVAAGLSER